MYLRLSLLLALYCLVACGDSDASPDSGVRDGNVPDQNAPDAPAEDSGRDEEDGGLIGDLCEDSCGPAGSPGEWANDGECDDGGPGAMNNLCTFGTDCADCGPRRREPPPEDMGVPDRGVDMGADTSVPSCPNTSDFACAEDLQRLFVCTPDGEIVVPCRGPNGCLPGDPGGVPRATTCDQSLNREGDRCAFLSGATCSEDRSRTLRCEDFTLRAAVRCADNSCRQDADGRVIACDAS